MERHFEIELQKLNKRINKMGNLVAGQVHLAMTALTECDLELAKTIVEQDSEVDELDVKIDKLCQRIFALTQPVATDLRLIMASLKMNNDLERMGDHAVGIAKRVESIAEFREFISEFKIDEVAAMTDLLVKDVVNILTSRKTVFVKDIFETAGMLKDKAQGISAKIVEEMTRKSDVIVVATNLMMVLTQMERIAGYSTNIAESVIFLVEGRVVKHAKHFKENSEEGEPKEVE
jgi:phosphate transport system protein